MKRASAEPPYNPQPPPIFLRPHAIGRKEDKEKEEEVKEEEGTRAEVKKRSAPPPYAPLPLL